MNRRNFEDADADKAEEADVGERTSGNIYLEGYEKADEKAKLEVEMGWGRQAPDIVTPAGIKQAYPMHPKPPPHMRWSSGAIKGLVYMVIMTGKGSQRQ